MFFEELVRIETTAPNDLRLPYELERSINYNANTQIIVYYPPLSLVFTIKKEKIKTFKIYYQMSIGYNKEKTMHVLTNIIDLCLELDKELPPTIFSGILNSEHTRAVHHFAAYGIASQYMAYAVIIYLASVKNKSYTKSEITLLLRHTFEDVCKHLFFSTQPQLDAAKEDIRLYINHYHPEWWRLRAINVFLDNSIEPDTKKDDYFGSTFFYIENGAVFEYRGFKIEHKSNTLFPTVQSVGTTGMGIKKSVKNKISMYRMKKQHKHTVKCRTKRGKCPLKKTRRRRTRGG